ncbi:extracellular solute-binding protein [Lentzea sp. NPDC051208]|uniref:ABC transporter substrate-binding protein n=1 Tax=Lentzea sp. NPDC051208 TaxID=3154642 RepID=UPI0034175BD5
MKSTFNLSRRSFLGGTLAAAGAFALTGCATSAGPQSSGRSAATRTSTVNFYGNSVGDSAQSAGWKEFIAGWEKSASATVKVITYPYDQASHQLALLGAKFQGVAEAGPWQVLAPLGVLADLNELAAGLDIPKGALDAYRIDGKLLAIPLTASGIGLVANGDIAGSAGLRSGMSTDEFASALERIKQQDSALIPYAAVTKNPDLKDAAHWMWGWGSEVVTPDLKCTIGDRESVEAITWYKGLQDAGLTKAGVARADARILFAQGKTAMYDDAPLASTFVRANGGSADLVANMTALTRPSHAGKPSFNRFWGKGLCASAGEGELSNIDFIKFALTDVNAARALFTKSSVLPSVKSVADQIPELTANKFQTDFYSNVAQHTRSGAWDRLPVLQQIDTTIGQGVANILAGQSDVQTGLNDLRKQVQGLLDKR